MNLELALFGIITGFTSGFFGIGGGTILVPLLLATGFVMKEAVAISIMQMVFSSIYGSFLNAKKAKDVIKDGVILGIGGSIGGLVSGYIVPNISNESLQYLFIAILIFSIIKIFYSPAIHINEKQTKSVFVLLLIGAGIGILAMSIGVGGSILLTPILVGYLKYDLKAAAALGLFFVIFSSIAGFISTSYHGQMLFVEGATVGIGSLIGVYFGIKVKDIVDIERAKQSIADMILFDAYVKDSAGGTGKSFNWDLLKDFTGEFILAGGINKQNIIRAIRTTKPYIVDISSGIEKDNHKDENEVKTISELLRKVG